IDFGCRIGNRDATSARRSRCSIACRNASSAAMGNETCTTSCSRDDLVENSAVLSERLRDKPDDAVATGDRCQVLQEECGDAATLFAVVDDECHLDIVGPCVPVVADDGDDVVAACGDERGPVAPVDVRESGHLARAQSRMGAEETEADGLGG